MHTFKSGVVRSGLKPRYDLVTREAIRFIADKMGEFPALNPDKDPLQYQKGGRDEEFIRDIKNHAHEHFLNYVATGDLTELKGALANLNMLAWLEVNRPIEEPVVDHPKDVDDLIYDQVAQEPAPVVEAEVVKYGVNATIKAADMTFTQAPCSTCNKTPEVLGGGSGPLPGPNVTVVQEEDKTKFITESEPLSLGKQLLSNFLSNFRHD